MHPYPFTPFNYVQVSKRFDFCTASAFSDKRLTLVHEDAAEFVRREVRQMRSRGGVEFANGVLSRFAHIFPLVQQRLKVQNAPNRHVPGRKLQVDEAEIGLFGISALRS